MGLRKGMTNNPAGRPAGTPNYSTAKIKQLLVDFLSANIDNIQTDFEKLDPKDKLQFIRDIAKICLPAPKQEIEHTTPTENLVDKLFPTHEELMAK